MHEINWGKSLEFLPTFTIKEIEKHRDASGKQFPVLCASKSVLKPDWLKVDRVHVWLGKVALAIMS